MVEFLAQFFVGGFVPDGAAVAADFDAFGPVAAAAVGPAAHVDFAVVNEDGLVGWGHDG